MLRSLLSATVRITVITVVFVLIARAQWRARNARRRSSGSLGGDNSNLDGVLGEGEFGFDARPDRRVR